MWVLAGCRMPGTPAGGLAANSCGCSALPAGWAGTCPATRSPAERPLPLPPACSDEGCYAGGTFVFAFRVPEGYPSDPPRVRCLTQVGGRAGAPEARRAGRASRQPAAGRARSARCGGAARRVLPARPPAPRSAPSSPPATCSPGWLRHPPIHSWQSRQVFHPAIDEAGHVDMSLLGDDWRPDMTIKTVIYGLWRLFLLPDSGARARTREEPAHAQPGPAAAAATCRCLRLCLPQAWTLPHRQAVPCVLTCLHPQCHRTPAQTTRSTPRRAA